MLHKVLSIAILCCLTVCAGCSESDPVGSDACQEQLAEKDATIVSLERKVQSQEKEIDALERGLSAQENAPRSQSVVKGTINIRAGNYSSTSFSVTWDMKNVRLQGHFREVAGTALYVYLFNDLNFQNWSANADSTVLYQSGEAVIGNIDVPIGSAGTYHLVFSNRHSWFSQKNVEAAVDLWFQM